jgi:hypothetical protein
MFGMFGQMMGQLQQPLPQDAGKPKHKSGMFGGGKPDWVSAIAAGLGALSAARGNPAGQIGLQMLNQRLGQKREDQQYERKQADEWNMWQRQQQWKLEHPETANNDTANDYAFWQSKLSPAEFEQWKQSQYDPVVTTAYGPILRSQLTGGMKQGSLPPVLSDKDFETQGGPAAPPPARFPGGPF